MWYHVIKVAGLYYQYSRNPEVILTADFRKAATFAAFGNAEQKCIELRREYKELVCNPQSLELKEQ